MEATIAISVAPGISGESWLRDPEFASFVAAYGYAATQSQAIPALSAIEPEALYHLFEALQRGQAQFEGS